MVFFFFKLSYLFIGDATGTDMLIEACNETTENLNSYLKNALESGNNSFI